MGMNWGQVKQFLADGVFFDTTDAKVLRQSRIVLKRAMSRVSNEMKWSYYHDYERINLKPTQSGLATVNVGSLDWTLGAAPVDQDILIGSHIQVQSTTTLYPITAVSGTTITTKFPFQASADIASTAYTIHLDTYELPSGIRHTSVMYDDNLFGSLDQMTDDDFIHHLRRVGPYATGPYAYTLTRHEVSGTKAVRFWPSPASSGTIDFFGYREFDMPNDDEDTIDWDPEKDALLYAALDLEGARLQFRGRDRPIEVLNELKQEYERLLSRYKDNDIVSMDLGGLNRPAIGSDGFHSFPTIGD